VPFGDCITRKCKHCRVDAVGHTNQILTFGEEDVTRDGGKGRRKRMGGEGIGIDGK